jgi:hypothetical protein
VKCGMIIGVIMYNVFSYSVMGLMCAGVFGGLVMAINSSASLPDVHFSYSTDECVRVVNYREGHNYTCDNLPTKYYHVWEK